MAFSSSSRAPLLPANPSMNTEVREWMRSHVDFSFKLANHVLHTLTKADSNLVFSPLSISVLLGLIAAGSNGPTLHQLLAFLNSKSSDDLNAFYSRVVSAVLADGGPFGGPRLSVANGAWIEQTLPLKDSYKNVVENVYKAVSESVDFKNKAIEVANAVNLWVEKETGGLIKQVLPPDAVNDKTRFILANALYFKGDWAKKFNASETRDGKFHLFNGSSVQVPFMRSWNRQCVTAFQGFKVLRLPYKQGEDKRRRFSMYIFLPDAKDGLPSLMQKVSSESGLSEELQRCLPSYPVEVGEFRIPKFKISFGFEVSDVLKELGVVSPFAGGEGITEMAESKLHVSKIIHKSLIEVNEEGTEAAAATVVVAMFGSSGAAEVNVDFVADHPFLYFIREDLTGAIVLVGTVINPLSD